MFLLLLLANLASAATWQAAKNDQLKLDIGFVSPSFHFETKGPNDNPATFKPNTPSKTYLGFAYRNVGLGYSFSNKAQDTQIADKGESTSTDFQFRFVGRHTFELAYQSYSGYFIDNSGVLDPAYVTGDSRMKKPDVKTSNSAFLYLYNFDSEDFSLTASITQTARQTSSGWGRFLFTGYNESVVSGNSSFVPAAYASSFGEIGTLKKLTQKNLLIGGALGGTLTTGKFYITGLLGLGAAAKAGTASFDAIADKTIQGSGPALIVRFGMGYNGEYHVVAITGINDATGIQISGGELNTQMIESRVTYSYRLDGVNIPPLNWVSSLLD